MTIWFLDIVSFYYFSSVWFLYGISLLVADVEVKEDGVFIRLRKETVVCEDKDSAGEVPSSVPVPVVEEAPEIGSEAAVSFRGRP